MQIVTNINKEPQMGKTLKVTELERASMHSHLHSSLPNKFTTLK